MKKAIFLLMSVLAVIVSCERFDDSAIWEELKDHDERITRLEVLCKEMNSNIVALQAVLEAMETNDYVTDIVKIMENGVEIGYSITFAKGGTVNIYHGKDGEDGTDGANGTDGSSPKIGIRKASDGEYYWTSDDQWLTDEQGNMIPATVRSDKDVTPQFRVADGQWYISYDGGNTWQVVGGTGGSEDIFKDVTYDDDNVYFTLSDGTTIAVAKGKAADAAVLLNTVAPDYAIFSGKVRKQTIDLMVTVYYGDSENISIYDYTGKVSINEFNEDRFSLRINDLEKGVRYFYFTEVISDGEISYSSIESFVTGLAAEDLRPVDLFVFAGQSNMMGAAHLAPVDNPVTEDALEYKYAPVLKGGERGEFVYAQNPAGDWHYIDPEVAYSPDYKDEATGKSKMSKYSTNTYFVPACRDKEKGFSGQSEYLHYPSASMPPYFAQYYSELGHPCIYAHMAKGACNILHYFTVDATEEYNRLITEYNAANKTSHATIKVSNLSGGGDAFDAKYTAMLRDFSELKPNTPIAHKCFVWLQGEGDTHVYAQYKIKLQALWSHLQSLGFTHFFILRVGFWGSTSLINEIKAQTDFCEENENCYIITRAPSLIPHPSANTSNWWISEPSEEYTDCRDSYISSTSNQHFNEKAHKIFARKSAENIDRILHQGLEPELEEENIKGML